MALAMAAVCGIGGVIAFAPSPSLAPGLVGWRSPTRSSGRSPRISDVLAVRAVEVEERDEGHAKQGKGEEDIPNLFAVTPVPTYEEMLAWAEETDKRMAAGELPPLGSRRHASGAAAMAAAAAAAQQTPGATYLSDQEQAQMATLAELLGKRRQQGSPLSEEEESTLRHALAGLSASVDNEQETELASNDGGIALDSDPGANYTPSPHAPASDGGGGGADDLVHNQIYGSREVRDKVYLYAWSLMKNRQERAEREAAEQQQHKEQQQRQQD